MIDCRIKYATLEQLYDLLLDDDYGFFHIVSNMGTPPEWFSVLNGYEDYADSVVTDKYGLQKCSRSFMKLFKIDSDGSIVINNPAEVQGYILFLVQTNTNSWNKIKTALFANYSPIENYDMTEDENVGSKISQAVTQGVSTYGYNSNDPVPSGEGESRTTTTGNYNDNKRKLTRHGNIGVTTNQTMIEAELRLRKKKLIDIIISDLVGYLTRPNY